MSRLCDAANEQLSVANYPFPQVGSCAVRFWPTTGWYGSNHAILMIYTDAPHSFSIFKGTPGNTWLIGWISGGVDGRVIFTGQLYDDNSDWNLITVSWDASRTDKTQCWTINAANKNSSLATEDLSSKTLYVGNHNGEYTLNGIMGEVAIWNEAFGADTLSSFCAEDQAMRSGFPMFRVRPHALMDWWPMLGDDSPEPNWAEANPTRTLTVTNATKGNREPNVGLWKFQQAPNSQIIQAVEGRPDFMPVFSRILTMQGINQ